MVVDNGVFFMRIDRERYREERRMVVDRIIVY